MAETLLSRAWGMRALYVLVALAILFWQLLPLSTLPAQWAGPDVLMAVTFAWAMRRPDAVPIVLVALVLLLADLLLQRPPGLLALLVLIGAEQLKARAPGLRDASFAGEWAAACIVMVVVAFLNRVILSILVVEQAPLALTLSQTAMTILVYPVVVFLSQVLFGVRRIAAGEDDAMGSRI